MKESTLSTNNCCMLPDCRGCSEVEVHPGELPGLSSSYLGPEQLALCIPGLWESCGAGANALLVLHNSLGCGEHHEEN